jgi:alpha,alpha-trehalose-phosphate synthase [UDP-forming]
MSNSTNKSLRDQSHRRLIVVSNRLPVRLDQDDREQWRASLASGGLVTALSPVLKRRGGVWVGWPGTTSGEADALQAALDAACEEWPYGLVPVCLDDLEVRNFYRGFANEIVWPLFHDCFNLCNFDPRYWDAYKTANRKFARTVANVVRPDDVLWVHDYHLMDAGRELRRLGVENKVGFFTHIPFPTPDIFRRLPWREEILTGLLDYDLIGFQLARDAVHFSDCLSELVGSERGGAGLYKDASSPAPTKVGHFPISIDFGEFAEQAASEQVRDRAADLKAENQHRQLILGVDRLDYSKGLLEKLAGFRYALEHYPELRGRITLIQHVVPSREKVPEYRSLRLRIERTVSEINGHFSEPGWIPVHYHFQTLQREELCAYYQACDICLVTSMKDGMNLVAKEYCAAQASSPGVLILSEFTGSAAELGEHALQVNPFDVVALAAAIYGAAAMDRRERAERMRRLREHVRRHDVHHWVDRYLEALGESSLPRSDSAGAVVAAAG